MKTLLNTALSIFAPLASVPTGWAIFAGVTGQPAFPMQPIAAGVGAVAIILVDVAAALLITDAYQFKQSAHKSERAMVQPLWWAWGILITAVIAEIMLSLLIVVFPALLTFGVLAFPIMTLAGVFTIAVQSDLQERIAQREQMRVKTKRVRQDTAQKPQVETQVQKSTLQTCTVAGCGMQYKSKGAHMRHRHPELCKTGDNVSGYKVSFEPVRKASD